MVPRLLLAALLMASTNAAACSLLVATDGFATAESEHRAEGGAMDAAAENAAEAQADALADGGREASSGPFCLGRAPLPAFCWDFDNSSQPLDGWTFQSASPTGQTTTALDTTGFVSDPKSIRLGVPAGVPGNGSGFSNRIAWEPSVATLGNTSAHIECQMRVNALDGVTAAFLMSVTFRTTNPYYITLIASRTTAVLLEETGPAGTATKTSLTRLVPFGAWTKVDFDVDFAAATPSLTLKFDGVVALTKQLASGFESGFEQLSIGPRYYTLATVVATDVNFDNVLIDLK